MFIVSKPFNTVSHRFRVGREFVRSEFEGTEDYLQNLISLEYVAELPDPLPPVDPAPAAEIVASETPVVPA